MMRGAFLRSTGSAANLLAYARASAARLAAAVLLTALAVVLVPATAHAAVTVSRAELSGTKLRLEGRALANRTITVNSVAMATSDGAGNFRVERDPFSKPADCEVAVNDGSETPTTATLSGCTVSSSPSPPPPPASSSPALSTVTIVPNEVVQGASATGTVTLTTAAPSGGVVVDLTNDYPHIATVPANVTVPAGSTSARFAVATSATTTGSAIIVGTIGGDWSTHKYAIITTYTEFHFNNGSISIIPSGTGSGTVTSSPAGINCTIARGNGSGACGAFFPVRTVVRLEARPASGSEFRGWRTNLPGCSEPSRIVIARGTDITCGALFYLK